jgi:hypothetical protein
MVATIVLICVFYGNWRALPRRTQGCQMASFQTKNPNLGIFWGTLEWKML